MSFTSLKTGGSYKHNHGYGVHYGEYFGSINNIYLHTSDAAGVNSWAAPQKVGTMTMTHTGNQSSSHSTVDGYVTYANTGLTVDLSVPYISVYFWRRTV